MKQQDVYTKQLAESSSKQAAAHEEELQKMKAQYEGKLAAAERLAKEREDKITERARRIEGAHKTRMDLTDTRLERTLAREDRVARRRMDEEQKATPFTREQKGKGRMEPPPEDQIELQHVSSTGKAARRKLGTKRTPQQAVRTEKTEEKTHDDDESDMDTDDALEDVLQEAASSDSDIDHKKLWRPSRATRPYAQPRPTFARHAPPTPKPTTIGMAMARMNHPFKRLSWGTPAVFTNKRR